VRRAWIEDQPCIRIGISESTEVGIEVAHRTAVVEREPARVEALARADVEVDALALGRPLRPMGGERFSPPHHGRRQRSHSPKDVRVAPSGVERHEAAEARADESEAIRLLRYGKTSPNQRQEVLAEQLPIHAPVGADVEAPVTPG
jgi:hypothetical protein